VVGLNRVRLDEYPVEALREALVNAVAHRRYEDGGRKILLEVFSDRVVISSPGMPPSPITIERLRKGKYRPCSRNPVLAQCLSFFHRIEERGSGFRRMREHMLNHGLGQVLLGSDTGYFQISFPGPGENLDQIRVPATGLLVTPAVEAQLNKRQRKIMEHVMETGSVTTGWCIRALRVARDTAHRDLINLVRLNILAPKGAGRAVAYVPKQKEPNAEIIR
jgi:predicted HTH transcriptional regulator